MAKASVKANSFTSTQLKDSFKEAPIGVIQKPVSAGTIIELTLMLRRKNAIDTTALHTGKAKPISRKDFAAQYGADENDIHTVTAFVAAQGLSVTHTDAGKRTVQIKGKAGQICKIFGVDLHTYTDADGKKFRGRTGYISIPDPIKDAVEGIFGLDNRVNAKTHFQVYQPSSAALPIHTHFQILGADPASSSSGGGVQARDLAPALTNAFYPTDVAKLYNFPVGVDGSGQCVAILELDGGHTQKDLDAYFKILNIPTPTVIAVGVDGALNAPIGNPNSADGEVLLDIEVVGCVAPAAKIVVYYAPNTDQGFLNGILAAIHDDVNQPTVISISWGSSENTWTTQSLNAYNDAFQSAGLLGVTVCAAAGDQGSSDGFTTDGNVHLDFPSSSPYVVSCGGTKITAANNQIVSESVWNENSSSAGGGGVSDFFALPDYQKGFPVPASISGTNFIGRGSPDLAGDADPASGYRIMIDGGNYIIGGTSAVAPLIAGLIALTNQLCNTPIGYIHPIIYAHPEIFRDITQGDNITTPSKKGFTAQIGWDACTGLGVPDGFKFSQLFSSL